MQQAITCCKSTKMTQRVMFTDAVIVAILVSVFPEIEAATWVVLYKGVLKNFAKFSGKHLCRLLFLNKVAELEPETILEKRLRHRYFPTNLPKFSRTPSLRNTSGCLLQHKVINRSLLPTTNIPEHWSGVANVEFQFVFNYKTLCCKRF